jgi:hypothetical protein
MELMIVVLQLVIWVVMIGGIVYLISLAVSLNKAFRDLRESLDVAKAGLETQTETNRLLSQVLDELRAGR